LAGKIIDGHVLQTQWPREGYEHPAYTLKGTRTLLQKSQSKAYTRLWADVKRLFAGGDTAAAGDQMYEM